MKNTKWDEGRLKNWASLAFRVGIAISLALVVIGFIILIYISGFKDIQPLVRLEADTRGYSYQYWNFAPFADTHRTGHLIYCVLLNETGTGYS